MGKGLTCIIVGKGVKVSNVGKGLTCIIVGKGLACLILVCKIIGVDMQVPRCPVQIQPRTTLSFLFPVETGKRKGSRDSWFVVRGSRQDLN